VEVEKCRLWVEAFGKRKNDVHARARDHLAQELIKMRSNVEKLVSTIPADCKDLTDHSGVHLDALWELASLIAGSSFTLNPAEAFVLGASILLHDAGMSVAAFPTGLAGLKSTEAWADIAAATLRQNGHQTGVDAVMNPPAELLPEIKFATLRAVHAGQAESMATEPWKLPGLGSVYLIEDLELRQAFGMSIGRIAHSHHWDIERVANELHDNLGGCTDLPVEWSISERKVACLLRCADASHIDRRRAPTMLFAALRPSGIAAIHWSAQNKINKPTVSGSALIYSSGQAYRAEEADAWWLAYDLIRLVDKEIRSSNALLEELKYPTFEVRRVAGSENPRALSQYLRPHGWRPVDAEIKVSDPAHLASTLGGRNLYGRDPLVPIRELLQNAADAIRGRRALENRGISWGTIQVTIEPHSAGSDACWLHVDDDGIGMTERVMSGPLIDFGKSLWNSPLLREEFPGLQGKNITPIGKFGIGFFSVFELGGVVRVTSKHYKHGISDARTLEFNGLSARPIIRPSFPDELPQDCSTRVSILVDEGARVTAKTAEPSEDPYFLYRHGQSEELTFSQSVRRLVTMLDVKVKYVDKVSARSFTHNSEVYESYPFSFFDQLFPHWPDAERDAMIKAHSSLLRPIVSKDGGRYGRAAIYISGKSRYRRAQTSFVSVGGFLYPGFLRSDHDIIGILNGDTDNASRRVAKSAVPEEVLAAWATEQGSLIEKNKYLTTEVLRATEQLIRLGGDTGSLPYAFHKGGLISYETTKGLIRSRKHIRVVLSMEYEHFKVLGYAQLSPVFLELPLNEGVFVLSQESNRLFGEELSRAIVKGSTNRISQEAIGDNNDCLKLFLETVTELWGSPPSLDVEMVQIFEDVVYNMPNERWTLTLRAA